MGEHVLIIKNILLLFITIIIDYIAQVNRERAQYIYCVGEAAYQLTLVHFCAYGCNSICDGHVWLFCILDNNNIVYMYNIAHTLAI